jgi:hypothetical protein
MDGIQHATLSRFASFLEAGRFSIKEASMTWRLFVALALLGATVSPAAAVPSPAMPSTTTRDGGRVEAAPLNDATAAPQRVVGKVLAIDPQHGSFLLGTDAGMIALRAAPEDLAELQVGQTLEIEVVDDESSDEPNSTWQ